MAGNASSPRATGGQIDAGQRDGDRRHGGQPDDDVERAARPVGEQDEAGRDRPAHDEGDGDEPEFEPADPHVVSLSAARPGGPPAPRPQVPAEDGTAGSSRGPCGDPPTCPYRTGPDRPGGDRGQRDTWVMAGQAPRGSRGHGRSSRPASSLPRARRPPRPDVVARPRRRSRRRPPGGPGTTDPGDPGGLSAPAHEGPQPD